MSLFDRLIIMRDSAKIHRICLTWVLLAVAITVTKQVSTLERPFSYSMAFVSADVTTMARSFITHGFEGLRFVPVNNNPPLGSEVSAYLHWPPLMPILLGLWAKAFGISELSTHSFSLFVAVVFGMAVYSLAACTMGKIGGWIALFTWLVLPVSLEYMHLPSQQAVGIAFGVAALVFAIQGTDGGRLWRIGSIVAMCAAAASTWEAALIGPGLIVAGLFTRRRDTVWAGFRIFVAAVVSSGIVLTLYFVSHPGLITEMCETVVYRLGLGRSYGSGILHPHSAAPQLSALTMVGKIVKNLYLMIGAPGLFAVCAVTIATIVRPRPAQGTEKFHAAFLAMFVSGILWYILFTNHVSIHDFEALILTPCVALAVAWITLILIDRGRRSEAPYWELICLLVVLPACSLAPLLIRTASVVAATSSAAGLLPSPYYSFVEAGKEIKDLTEPGAVIVVPNHSTIPLFYSERHFVRVVTDEQMLARILPALIANFGEGTPIYLALVGTEPSRFPHLLGDVTGTSALIPGNVVTLVRVVPRP